MPSSWRIPAACSTARAIGRPHSTYRGTPRSAFLASDRSRRLRNTLIGLAAFLGCIAEMLRIRFYNRRFASRAPALKTPSLETSRRAPWENPPAFAFEIRLEQGAWPLFGGDAGPPRGHPASSGRVLDGTPPASGREAPRRACAPRGESAGAFSAAFTLRRSNPLTPPEPAKTSASNAHFLWPGPLPRAARQCRPLARAGDAFRRRSPEPAPFRTPAPEPCSRWPTGAGAARVHRGSRTSTRPFSAPLSRAFCGRVHQNDLCRSMFQRARRWTARASRPRNPWPDGRLSIDRCLSIVGDRRRCSGSGVEDHRASTFPPGIAPERDFAPTPIASDTSCRGHCRTPCLEWTRANGEAAGAANASKASAARGRCGA